MPLIGNQAQLNYTKEMWENLTEIIDRGIPLFQIEAIKPSNFSSKIFGFWNVKCGTRVVDLGHITPWTRWYKDADAYVEFWPNKTGICTAFVPDDKEWFNRTKLAGMLYQGVFG